MNDSREDTIQSFTDLTAWQKGHEFVVEIYAETKSFPKKEMYGLTSQLPRSASSITANIAEGFGRQTYQEKVQFFYTAKGSLTETKDHLLVAKDVGYISQEVFQGLADKANKTGKLLQGLIKKTKSFVEQES